MSKDRLTEAKVSLAEVFMAPPAISIEEQAELTAIDRDAFRESGLHEMSEGVEVYFSELSNDCCKEDRELILEQNSDYAATHEQFEQFS